MEDRLYLFFGFLGHDMATQVVVHSLIAMVIALVVAKFATKNMQIVPGGCQNVLEATIGGILQVGGDVIGKNEAKKYLPLTGALAIFIFFSNMIGIIPGFESPTANVNLTLSLALIVFFYYHFEGIKRKGVIPYFAHFMGPVKWLAPLMFPIEIISHFSRIISLSFRLMGNIKGDDLFLAVLLMLVPWIVPLPAFFLLFFFGTLQAFIFMILTYVYIAGAIELEEHAL
jgi:F-type H+-transporting ATPase subunit a